MLKIGASVSQSGALFESGTSLLEGYEFWVDTVNEAGGIPIGDDNYLVEFIVYDDESDTTTAATLADRLITQDEVDFLFGPFSSGMALAVGAITDRHGTVMIQSGGNADNIFEQGWTTMFGLIPMASTIPIGWMGSMLEQDPTPTSIAIVAKDDPFPQSQRAGLREAATDAGLEVVADEVFPPDTQDFSGILATLRSAEPDLVAFLAHTEDNVRFVRQSRELSYAPAALFYSGGSMLDFLGVVGEESEMGMGPTFFSASMQAEGPMFGTAQEFAAAFREATGSDPDWLNAGGAAAGLILATALERAGTTDPAAVVEELRSGDFPTFQGAASFDERGLNLGAVAMVEQIIDGEIHLVGPSAVAEREPVYPALPWSER